jgi:hypothetical protein
MMTNIGIVSGEILNLLDEKQTPVSITEIKCRVDEPVDVIHMSIGWLIRENYVRVIKGSETYLIVASKEASSHRLSIKLPSLCEG